MKTLKTFKTIHILKDTQSENPKNIQNNSYSKRQDTQSEHPKTFKTIQILKDTQSEHPNNIRKNKQTIQILKDTQSEHPKTFKRTKNLHCMK